MASFFSSVLSEILMLEFWLNQRGLNQGVYRRIMHLAMLFLSDNTNNREIYTTKTAKSEHSAGYGIGPKNSVGCGICLNFLAGFGIRTPPSGAPQIVQWILTGMHRRSPYHLYYVTSTSMTSYVHETLVTHSLINPRAPGKG